jgi:hypothetical protein
MTIVIDASVTMAWCFGERVVGRRAAQPDAATV